MESPLTFSLMTSVQDVLLSTTRLLQEAGIEHADHESKILLGSAFGVSLSDISLASIMGMSLNDLQPVGRCRANRIADRQAYADTFTATVIRRSHHEPLQYIVGHTPFRYIDVALGPGVFIPRPETETLVSLGLDYLAGLEQKNGELPFSVIDLCAGSGVVGLSLLTENKQTQVYAVEKDQAALVWTEKNARRICQSSMTDPSRYRLLQADATDPSAFTDVNGTMDLVVTNPPYVPESEIPEQVEVRDYDPPQALYGGSSDGLRIPEQIILRSFNLLKPGGCLILEHDPSQGSALRSFASDHGFCRAETVKDLNGRERFLTAFRP